MSLPVSAPLFLSCRIFLPVSYLCSTACWCRDSICAPLHYSSRYSFLSFSVSHLHLVLLLLKHLWSLCRFDHWSLYSVPLMFLSVHLACKQRSYQIDSAPRCRGLCLRVENQFLASQDKAWSTDFRHFTCPPCQIVILVQINHTVNVLDIWS